MAVFKFRSNSGVKGDPQAVGEELARLHSANGGLRPEEVVENARDPNSPLHSNFEWDDGKAAEEHRKSQARRLIASVRILTPSSEGPKQTIAWISVKTPEVGRAYQPALDVLSDAELRLRALSEVKQAIEGLQRRFAHMLDLSALLDAAKKMSA